MARIGQYECVQTRPSMKDRVRTLREEAILDASRELIESKGYAAMTLDDITEAVGVSKPTLYLHFRSKEDIIRKLSDRCIHQVIDYLESLDPSRPAASRLEDFIVWCVSTRFGENSLLFQDLSLHILPTSDPASEHYLLECSIIESVTALFETAQNEDGIRGDIPPIMLSAMLLGFVKNWRIDEMLRQGKLDHKIIATSWMSLLRKP